MDDSKTWEGMPIELDPGLVASRPSDLVNVILDATNRQVAEKAIADAEARADFAISSDALNYWRVAWRCSAEWNVSTLAPVIADLVKAAICKARGYDPDDFDSALQATSGRVRLPYGWSPLDLAWHRASREPIRLLDPSLADRRGPTLVAGLARQLQILQEAEPILLPIDQIRELLGQRKIVVSGTVQRLIEAGLITYADKNYHTGKAREFRFTGVEGEHFVKVDGSRPLTPPARS